MARDFERLTDAHAVLSGEAAGQFGGAGNVVAVVAPPTAESLAAVLKYCSDRALPVLPAGSGTWLRDALDGRAAARPVVVSTVRLRGILEHEPADLVIGVAAGTPLEQISAQLARHHQMLPLDPPAMPGSTIGAVIALGAAGPLRAGHGPPRDVVLGLEVVTGDGRLLRFGGRVVKNVAGYDGVRLFTGSRGALGIITAAYIRVRGMPARDVTLVLAADGVDSAAELARRIAVRVPVDAIEVVGQGGAGHGRWSVLVRVMGSDVAVDDACKRIDGVAARSGRASLLEGKNAADRWRGLALDEGGAAVHFRLHVPSAQGPATLAQTVRMCPPDWHFGLHAADGVVRAWRPESSDDGSIDGGSVDSAFTEIAAEIGRLAPAADGTADPVRRRIVAAFDPAGILRAGYPLHAGQQPATGRLASSGSDSVMGGVSD